MRRAPRRTCIGCRQVRPRAALLRLVRGDDGRARVDARGIEVGRGAYVCPRADCLGKALVKGRLAHAFRRPTLPPAPSPEAIVEALGEEDKRLWRHV